MVMWIVLFWGVIMISLASWKFSRIVFWRLSQSSLRSRVFRSVFSSSLKRARRPRPGGATPSPLGFSRRNLSWAISSMDGVVLLLLAEMKTIISLRPLRYSGR